MDANASYSCNASETYDVAFNIKFHNEGFNIVIEGYQRHQIGTVWEIIVFLILLIQWELLIISTIFLYFHIIIIVHDFVSDGNIMMDPVSFRAIPSTFFIMRQVNSKQKYRGPICANQEIYRPIRIFNEFHFFDDQTFFNAVFPSSTLLKSWPSDVPRVLLNSSD